MTALIVVAVMVVLLVLAIVWSFNGMVKTRNQVDNAWSQIDVQLKRRCDLIPNLVNTVKGYAAHERTTFDAVVNARDNAMRVGEHGSVAERAQAENALTGTLKTLFALSEAYPDLKANANFLALQSELSATEDRIAFARQMFNDSVLRYNTRIQTLPRSLVAGAMHFTAREPFEADPGAVAPVVVGF